MAPIDTDIKDEETTVFKLGHSNCDYLTLKDINYLIAVSKHRVNLNLEEINWARVFKNSFDGEMPSQPKFGTEYLVPMYIKNENPKALESILEYGADPDVIDDTDGKRPIELAIEYGDERAVAALIKAGCILTEVSNKTTPVLKCINQNDPKLTAALFKN
eukprot:CAMPEP_0114577328 /NCGR_PEP_ID=MMETSP0125-20121206/2000_1 /TAXON_ID=485358 ORGANISM="Aristerostoma sp., Strain ATCC 50986" /NCGR_SAMPLE_ID=MMETSP0125 /ASSEMBLY_ACC=CAM_ASM_000245 /LENGTH=159 /DNA_ID=CAMNT_0001766553 /DNA_START=3363 /DNA_END=3842 /DNA_ORIENTATION=-